jgi:hypothetical protein
METARLGWGAGAVLLGNGNVLIAGGVDTSTGHVLASAELYDPSTGVFTSAGSMSTPRVHYALVVLGDGQVLAAGGLDDQNTALSSADLYNPASGTWSTTQSMSVARYSPGAVVLTDGSALVFGGASQIVSFNPGTGLGSANTLLFLSSAEIYEPTSGMWQPTGSMLTAQGFAPTGGTRLLDGRVLVVGPYDTEIYAPQTGTFSPPAGPLPSGVAGNDVVVTLGSGDAFVLGVRGIPGSTALFDPSSNTFSAAATDPTAPSAGILMNNETVFSAGGQDLSGAPTTQTAIYRAASGTWETPWTMVVPRYSPALANLPDGSVLVMGGCQTTACGSTVLASAEICGGSSPSTALGTTPW